MATAGMGNVTIWGGCRGGSDREGGGTLSRGGGAEVRWSRFGALDARRAPSPSPVRSRVAAAAFVPVFAGFGAGFDRCASDLGGVDALPSRFCDDFEETVLAFPGGAAEALPGFAAFAADSAFGRAVFPDLEDLAFAVVVRPGVAGFPTFLRRFLGVVLDAMGGNSSR